MAAKGKPQPLARMFLAWILGVLALTLILTSVLVLAWERSFLAGELKHKAGHFARTLAVVAATGGDVGAGELAISGAPELRAADVRDENGRRLWHFGPPIGMMRQDPRNILVISRQVAVPAIGGKPVRQLRSTVALSRRGVRLHLVEAGVRVVLALGAALSLAFLAGLVFLDRMVAPLERLSAWAHDWDLTAPVPLPARGSGREVADLADAFSGFMERLRADRETLTANEQRFREFFDASPAPLLVVDGGGVIRRANRAAEPFLGVDAQSAAGRAISAYVDDLPDGFPTTPGRREVRWRLPAGEIATVEISVESGLSRQWDGNLLVLHDVTDRLRRAGELWRRTFDAMTDGVAVVDSGGQVSLSNRAFERDAGWIGEEMSRRLPAGGEHEWEARRGDRTVHLRLSGAPDGGAILTVRDVTARVRAEERVRQAVKSEAVTVLASGVAHDFNNLLSALLLHVRLVEKDPLHADQAVAAIRELAERGVEVVQQLLEYARHGGGTPTRLNLTEVVRSSESFARFLLGSKAALTIEAPPSPLEVCADAVELKRVLLNLVVNARDALPHKPGGRVRITLRRDAEHAILDVEDNGTGIPPELSDRVFEPYVSSRDGDAGSGLGLAAVAAIVEAYGGSVEAGDSDLGGARIRVQLPLADAGEDAC
ncbi:MAG: PAS domain S-box protein [Acidobacteria bacterium]|nr:PAS domain S-box protein [Acidobacteriota bacterium]